jgi:glycerol dehydrogenase
LLPARRETLAELGLRELSGDVLGQMARRATAPGKTIHNEPFEVTPDMVADALFAADAGVEHGRHKTIERDCAPRSSLPKH